MTQQRISNDPTDDWRSRDIVQELRGPPNWTAHYDSINEVRPQKDMPSAWPYAAADEIERLRALLVQKDAEIAALKAEAFCSRFKARMLAVAGKTFDDGSSIAEYADEVAPTYFEQPWQREDGPEACADADMSYWGE